MFHPRSLIPFLILSYGCSHSVSVQQNNGTVHLENPSSFATIAVGGLSFPGPDTVKGTLAFPTPRLINFDFLPNATIRNDSNAAVELVAAWRFGVLQSIGGHDTLITDIAGLPEPDTSLYLDAGTLAPGQSLTITLSKTVKLSDYLQVDDRLVHQRFAYQLMLYSRSHPVIRPILTATAPFDPSAFNGRYHGFIYTSENSPDPLATVDGTEDPVGGSSTFHGGGVFPNPTLDSTTVVLDADQPADSVRADLFITPHYAIKGVFSLVKVSAGSHLVRTGFPNIDPLYGFPNLRPGLYKLVVTAWQGSAVTELHENICIRRP
jgi:hypothetical protein